MKIAAIAALLAVLGATAASAAALSMNESPLAAGATLEDCKSAARDAIARAELRVIPDSELSVFGAGPNGLLAAIYCLPERGTSIVAVAGESSSETGPMLRRILGYLAE